VYPRTLFRFDEGLICQNSPDVCILGELEDFESSPFNEEEGRKCGYELTLCRTFLPLQTNNNHKIFDRHDRLQAVLCGREAQGSSASGWMSVLQDAGRVSYPLRDVQAKGTWDGTAALHPFRIQRYYCKSCRRTFSLHPIFSHTRKRYALSVAAPCIETVILKGRSIRSTARSTGVDRRTIGRWVRGWSRHEQEKRLAFFTYAPASPQSNFGAELLKAIRGLKSGRLLSCMAEAMLRLMKSFDCPLY
jgi:hypothetical protein